MVKTPVKRLYTFEEYLAGVDQESERNDGNDKRYELVDGELVEMPPATGRHARTARFLFVQFLQEIQRLSSPWVPCYGDVGVRTALRRARIPDLVIITQEQEQALLDILAVLQTPPLLAVEIVSERNSSTDYRYKRSEYAAMGIPEYWIVDYFQSKVTLLLLVDGLYEAQEFTGDQRIVSETFPELALTAAQVLGV
jgi:Uma2 family endonuclease